MGQHYVLTLGISSLCSGGQVVACKRFYKKQEMNQPSPNSPFYLPLPSSLCFYLRPQTFIIFYLFVAITIWAHTSSQHLSFASSKPPQADGGFYVIVSIILLMKEAPSNDLILRILETPYETRTQTEHKTLSGIIVSSMHHCSSEFAKKLSFFLGKLSQEQEPPIETLLIVRMDPHADYWQSHHFHHQPSLLSLIASSSLVLCLSSGAIKKSEVMAGSIEQQIKILQSGQYFTQVPKRRFYSVIQQAEAVVLGYGEYLKYEEKKPHDVYLARKGEFSYVVKDGTEEKNIEIYSFREGHLFSMRPFVNEMVQQEGKEEAYEKLVQSSLITAPAYMVRCKSSRGVLYRFSREFFNSHLLRYCQTALTTNSQRLNTLLQARTQQVSEIRKPNTKLLAQKIPRSLSQELQVLRDSKAGCGRKASLPKEPQPILDISQKSHDYHTLKLSQLTRNKLYSKAQLATASFDPQKNESDLLLWKKSKCLRLQQLSKSSRPALSKAETMMQFMKSTIQFEKTRKKPTIL